MDEQVNQDTAPSERIQRQFNKIRNRVEESATNFEQRNRVTITTILLMVLTAIFYDVVEAGLDFIPFLGWILSGFVGIFAWLTFYVWTSIEGWGMSDTVKKFVVSRAIPLIGVIPIFNALPEITLSVIFSILIVKSDDFIYNRTKGRVDIETVKQGLQFFNLFRDVTDNTSSYSKNKTKFANRPVKNFNYQQKTALNTRDEKLVQKGPARVLEMQRKEIQQQTKNSEKSIQRDRANILDLTRKEAGEKENQKAA